MKATEKSYTVTLKTEYRKGCEMVKKEMNTKLNIDVKYGFSLGQIDTFFKDAKKIYREAIKATKKGAFIQFEITSASYENLSTPGCVKLNQIDFDRWFFEGYNNSVEGIYLSPDTRYTNSCHDLWITGSLMEELATI